MGLKSMPRCSANDSIRLTCGCRWSGNRKFLPVFWRCIRWPHLMIRELETKAGYPAASLKDRVYCDTDRDRVPEPMAGVLIYVAVPDTEGSLGGLMSQAEPHRFLNLLSAAVEAAAWCSLDPVCARQEGHGPGLLNGAACHACALLPETSCAFHNMLLDRSFVTDLDGGIPGLFSAGPAVGWR